MFIHSGEAGWARNFWTSIMDGEITVKGNRYKGSKGKEEKYIVREGRLTESIEKENNRKVHTVFGEYKKSYKNDRLEEERYYQQDWRIKWKGLFYRQVTKNYVLERYSSGGSICREIAYYGNGQLMYNLGRNKNVKIFNPDGTPLTKIKLSRKQGLWSGKYGLHLNIPEIKRLTATFAEDWHYELYDGSGNVCSWLKGKNGTPLDGVKDGHRLYFIRGIQVPKKVIDGTYDASYLLSYPNVTIRSEMMKKYGIEQIMQELQGETVDKNEEYELLKFPMPGGNADNRVMNVLKMKCPSTQVWYALRVPPECQNIGEAINWTYGLNLRDIRDTKQGVDILGAT
jgi:hypothetical protein